MNLSLPLRYYNDMDNDFSEIQYVGTYYTIVFVYVRRCLLNKILIMISSIVSRNAFIAYIIIIRQTYINIEINI